jgi:hypothetical protein
VFTSEIYFDPGYNGGKFATSVNNTDRRQLATIVNKAGANCHRCHQRRRHFEASVIDTGGQ